jgi:iron-sulfur cluster repair protein YtfE (RIC family)
MVIGDKQKMKSKAVQAAAKMAGLGHTKRKLTAALRRNGEGGAPDALILLKDDHRRVQKLFGSYENCGEKALQAKRRIVGEIIRELSQHAAIEEQFFYPMVRREVSISSSDLQEALEEHHEVTFILAELMPMDPFDERFDPKVAELFENVRHHMYHEEQELFPEVRARVGRKALLELGETLQRGKRLAPVRHRSRSFYYPSADVMVRALVGAAGRVRVAMNLRQYVGQEAIQQNGGSTN